mgnify:CR=1 FL=1
MAYNIEILQIKDNNTQQANKQVYNYYNNTNTQ